MRKLRVTRSIIPNLFTLMNLFCGFIAITYIAQKDYSSATGFIVLAGLFDLLDGAVARLTKATSEFGVELDSLCDAVSFGVAPSFLIYQVYFYQLEHVGIILAALPAMAGVMRLARFNIQVVGFEDKRYFTGVPIPAGALTVISYTISYFINPDPSLAWLAGWKSALMIGVSLIVPAAMVSTIKYDNFPRFSKKAITERPVIFAFFMIGIVGSVLTRGMFLFPFMALYIIGGFIRHIVLSMRARRDGDDDADTHEQPEPDPFDL